MAIDRLGYSVALAALCSLAACGQSAGSASGAFNSGGASSAGSTGNQSGPGSIEIDSPSDAGAPPPEKELDQTFRAPVATGKMLWSANPDSGRVALIDAETLAVRMTNAGFGPTYLAAVPSRKGTDSAIVLNVGSHDATWLVATAKDIAATTISTHAGANSWTVSDSGRFAIAWTNAAQIQGGAPDSVNGYSELTVIDLSKDPPTSTRLSVGFRPSQVVFDADAEHAYAVVDEGISVLSLGERPGLSRLISAASGASAAHARDVNFAPDGSFAAVRVEGSSEVEIISLPSGASRVLTLESAVTDLDLSADGTTATVILGNENPPKVASFAVPVPASDPAHLDAVTIPGEVVRSVTLAPDGAVAVLYANAVASSHVSLLKTGTEDHFGVRTVNVEGAVQAVYVSPDSATAITLQIPPAGSKKPGLFSIIPTESPRSPRIVGTDALPSDVVFSDATFGKALVTVHDTTSTVHGVYVIGLANLEQNFIPLSSDPLPGATGVVPGAKRGFVAQKHPEGRITFIDLSTGAAQTLSGFEIAARVVH
ncbi:MAG: hypothetical protein ABJB12_07095 [Pseudomonadota bacterium]